MVSLLVMLWGEFNLSHKRGEIPRGWFTVVFTVFLIARRGITLHFPVSGGSKDSTVWVREVTCFLRNVISACSSCTKCLAWETVVSRQGKHCVHNPKTDPKIIFSHITRHPWCCAQRQISAVSIQVSGQQPTWGYDLKCCKELFYMKERERKAADYGYTKPYSQGDPLALVWLQSDCEERGIKRIITQATQWSPITSWHTPLRRFISHSPDHGVYVFR